MTTILKGALSPRIHIRFSSSVGFVRSIEVHFCGVVHEYTPPIDEVSFVYTSDDTAFFPLGAHPLRIFYNTAAGKVELATNTRILVTDDPAAALSETIDVCTQGALEGEESVPDAYTLKDLHKKVNTIIARLGGAASVLVLAGALWAGTNTTEVLSARLDALPNSATVVTNITGMLTAATVEEIAREEAMRTRNMIYDDQTGVLWLRVMENGSLYYRAYTNVAEVLQ